MVCCQREEASVAGAAGRRSLSSQRRVHRRNGGEERPRERGWRPCSHGRWRGVPCSRGCNGGGQRGEHRGRRHLNNSLSLLFPFNAIVCAGPLGGVVEIHNDTL